MKHANWLIAVVALVVVIYVARHRSGGVYTARNYQRGASDTIEYRGERFKMSKAYTTWDDYKDDPDNLDTNELERIEKVMIAAKFPSSFRSMKEFIHALSEVAFPGYGWGGIQVQPQTDDGSKLLVMSVEIPPRDKERYFVAKESNDSVVLMDDFVSSTATNAIRNVKLQAGKLLYYDGTGFLVREKEVVKK